VWCVCNLKELTPFKYVQPQLFTKTYFKEEDSRSILQVPAVDIIEQLIMNNFYDIDAEV